MVSKAFVKSRNTDPAKLPLSMEDFKKSVNDSNAKFVELPARKPN